jgi:cobalt-zinc-cadmium efflux system membrane fusion protein
MQHAEDRYVMPTPEQSSGVRRRRRTRVLAVLAAVVAIGAVVSTFAFRENEAPPVASDVPKRVGGAVEVSAAFRDKAHIVTTPAARTPLAAMVKVVGSASFDPEHVAAVGTRAPGIVTKVHRVEGETVERGAPLAEVESPALSTAVADLRATTAKKRAALANRDRERDLLARSLTTAREYEQAQARYAEENALATAAAERVEALGGTEKGGAGISMLRAPLAGVIAERAIAPGQSVEASFVAFRIGNLDELWVLLRVFERHIELVRAGDPVEIRKVSDPDDVIRGTVSHVGAVLDPATRTADVRLIVDNRERRLRPGQAVEATIRASGPARVALSVPATAITYVDGAPTVFVAETPTRFVARQVELGLDAGERLEIRNGIREGEWVVSQSVIALKSELFR